MQIQNDCHEEVYTHRSLEIRGTPCHAGPHLATPGHVRKYQVSQEQREWGKCGGEPFLWCLWEGPSRGSQLRVGRWALGPKGCPRLLGPVPGDQGRCTVAERVRAPWRRRLGCGPWAGWFPSERHAQGRVVYCLQEFAHPLVSLRPRHMEHWLQKIKSKVSPAELLGSSSWFPPSLEIFCHWFYKYASHPVSPSAPFPYECSVC